jgi:hypothetical protein
VLLAQVFKNNISDAGAASISALVALQSSHARRKDGLLVREVHMSHNLVTDAGASLLTAATKAAYPAWDGHHLRPFWLRIELNLLSQGFEPGAVGCLAKGNVGLHCTPYNCACPSAAFRWGAPQVHLPFLRSQNA